MVRFYLGFSEFDAGDRFSALIGGLKRSILTPTIRITGFMRPGLLSLEGTTC
jgi:hypothetical protein